MTDELKSQITALRTAIMRRVEFDQCIHASSLEDEIGKWVREVLEPKQPKASPETTPWAGQISKMLRAKQERELLQSIYDVAMDSIVCGTGYMLNGKHVPAGQLTATQVGAQQVEIQRQQRLAQALAQQTFNQQIGNLGVGIGGAGGDMPLTTAADMVIGRETDATGQIIEVVASGNGTTYRRFA